MRKRTSDQGRGLALCVAAICAIGLPGLAFASETPLAPPGLEFVFEEAVVLAPDVPAGTTPKGRRNIIPILGGTVTGPAIRAEIMPGGWDWQLIRSDGCMELKADYFLKTDDGAIINVINQAVLCPPADGSKPAITTQPVFEAPLGKYDWLNRGNFIGMLVSTGDDKSPGVRIRFYRVR